MTKRKALPPPPSRRTRPDQPAAAPQVTQAFAPPYPPGWFDRVMDRIDRLPGPYALWYGVFALVVFALITLAHVLSGMPAFGGDLGQRAYSAFMTAFPAFLAHSLNRTAGRAFAAFEPALRSPAEAPNLRYRLTTAPRWPSLAFSLGSAAYAVLLVFGAPEMGPYLESVFGPPWAVLFFGALSYFVNSHFAYRVIYQLRQVSRIYRGHALVRLSDLSPHFALSVLTSRAAIVSILVVSGYLIGYSQLGDPTLTVVILMPNLLLAGAAFALPLLGAHQLLEAERDRVRREATLRMEAALAELHQLVERGDYGRATAVKDAVTALDIELNRLAHIPTWPWNPGTPRGVAAAVFLPVAIWLIQFGLQRLLG
jgi:hypothetical protein